MKRLLSILLLFALALPGLRTIGILIDFQINKDFIAEVLCINKDTPITMCEGSCYLTDQLQKAAEEEERQAPVPQSERLELNHFYAKSEMSTPFTTTASHLDKCENPYAEELAPINFLEEIFHPPQLHLA